MTEILVRTTGRDRGEPPRVLSRDEVLALRALCRDVAVAEPVLRYASRLVRASDPDDAGRARARASARSASARACAARSRWCSPRRPSRCSTGARTSRSPTSSAWRSRCCATGSSARSRARPTASRRIRSSPALVEAVPTRPEAVRAGDGAMKRGALAGVALAAVLVSSRRDHARASRRVADVRASRSRPCRCSARRARSPGGGTRSSFASRTTGRSRCAATSRSPPGQYGPTRARLPRHGAVQRRARAPRSTCASRCTCDPYGRGQRARARRRRRGLADRRVDADRLQAQRRDARRRERDLAAPRRDRRGAALVPVHAAGHRRRARRRRRRSPWASPRFDPATGDPMLPDRTALYSSRRRRD